MPIINVSIASKPDRSRSAAIATLLTELTRVHLQKDPAVTAVAINHIDPAHWFVGGQSLADLNASSFWLDIKVTAGTNTKAQMASYLQAVFREMSKLIGAVHDDSYIMVHEVPASAWGFSGKSQEYRYVAGILKAAA
jgi:4-oxalocrotonate tautomerase